MDRKDDNPYAAPQNELHVAPIHQSAQVLSSEIPRGPEWCKVLRGTDVFQTATSSLLLGLMLSVFVISLPAAILVAYALDGYALILLRYPMTFCRTYRWRMNITLTQHFLSGLAAIYFTFGFSYASTKYYADLIEILIMRIMPLMTAMILCNSLTTLLLASTLSGFGKKIPRTGYT